MKRYLLTLMMAAVAAGTALAQEGQSDAQNHKDKSWGDDRGGRPEWTRHGDEENRNRGDWQNREQMDRRPGPPMAGPMSAEMMTQMRDDHKAIRDLGEAARAETDETKKAELVSQLRAKLGDVADRMQTFQDQRLAQAEQQLASLKERIEYSKANRDKMIDEQVQRILAGEHPGRPDAFNRFPHAKNGQPGGEGEYGAGWRGDRNRGENMHGRNMGPGENMAPPPAENPEMAPPPASDAGMAPPPEQNMPGDMPPPEASDSDTPPPGE